MKIENINSFNLCKEIPSVPFLIATFTMDIDISPEDVTNTMVMYEASNFCNERLDTVQNNWTRYNMEMKFLKSSSDGIASAIYNSIHIKGTVGNSYGTVLMDIKTGDSVYLDTIFRSFRSGNNGSFNGAIYDMLTDTMEFLNVQAFDCQ